MIKDIIEAGGAGYIVPAVLFVFALYVIRGLFGLHGHKSQHRKEFLELWDRSRSDDDIWLEVAIRHLFGTYLPAKVIRLALAQPDGSQALRDLSELWPLFAFDRESQTVRWLHKRHDSIRKRKRERWLLNAGYFTFAFLAPISALTASHYEPGAFPNWVYGCNAMVFGFLALICLMREDTIKTSATVGEDWLSRINSREGRQNGDSKN